MKTHKDNAAHFRTEERFVQVEGVLETWDIGVATEIRLRHFNSAQKSRLCTLLFEPMPKCLIWYNQLLKSSRIFDQKKKKSISQD